MVIVMSAIRIGAIRMKNKEKYSKKIVELACDGNDIAVDKRTGKVDSCDYISCSNCLFNDNKDCDKPRREWAESEYIKKPVIDKKDRVFLEYLGEELKYIVRSKSDNLIAYQNSAEKREDGWVIDFGEIKSLQKLNIDFPMVKWEDDEPWLIEDLKKLEVVDSYE